ncbi:hypothetical protein BDV26DRAFT_286157 [Aspergillus bertholletiae]|uniref:C2H2-type domain-containing protein n=1 Tax=Aspergillus bertholletiae TaxID=1226010 RepID=A0A5N7AQR0_9EURO|nr:hypothetical protein BDV26DRAFT_286157 [Aspergillus bertholletiae]
MAHQQQILRSCECPEHYYIYDDWPSRDVKIRVAPCMKQCMYCPASFRNASRLRLHLRSSVHEDRNIEIKKERAGVSRFKNSHPTPSDNINTILEDIKRLFDISCNGSDLCDLAKISSNVQAIWNSSTVSVPVLLPSSKCWVSHAPLQDELIEDTVQAIAGYSPSMSGSESTFRVNFQGEVDSSVKPSLAIAQLVKPRSDKATVYLTGLRLPTVDKLGFRCPDDLCTVVEPMEESNQQVNLTPRFSFVDLHIDYGADGISTPIGDCQKVWFMYPPTKKNLAAIANLEGQRHKLSRLSDTLEAGIVVQTTSDHALYIPAGCLHATFTLKGGYLIASDFTTSQSIKAIGAYIASGLASMLSPEAREDCYSLFKHCLHICLMHRQLIPAVEACISAASELAIWAASNQKWRADFQRLWKENMQLQQQVIADKLFECPCKQQNGDVAFLDHFFSDHLAFLNYTSEQRSRKRRRV